jgi:hypothetical protein
VGRGDEVAFAVDEETVAIKQIVIAAVGGGLIDGINDGADRVEEFFVIRGLRSWTGRKERPYDTGAGNDGQGE